MSVGITAAVTKIQTICAALTGMKAAPSRPDVNQSVFPFTIAYAGPGTWDGGVPGEYINLGSINIDLYLSPFDNGIVEAVYQMEKFVETLPKAILSNGTDYTLSSTVTALGTDDVAVRFEGLGQAQLGATLCYICRWVVNYKNQGAL